MITQNKEDYLRAIYYIGEQNQGVVHSVDIVKYLKVSKPSVSEMLKKLGEQKYIKREPYAKVSFTAKGLIRARKLTFKHRVLEIFLKDILKVNKKDIHEEAHRLEHAFSDKTVNKLYKFLKKPGVCPHGHKIPKL